MIANHSSHWFIILLLIGGSGCRPSDGDNSESDATDGPSATSDELRILMSLPQFTLIDQTGNEFGSAQLDGKVWIANFMFTRCPGTCPVQTANLAVLQDMLNEDPGQNAVQLVSISVDPEYDSPSILSAFSENFSADGSRWHFLTGDRDYIWMLCKDGFKMSVSDAPPDSDSPILHSERFILVDQQRRVRALFNGTKREELKQLFRDIRKLESSL
jgi:protein SCO1/2